MKNKRLIIIISVLCLIVLVAILCSTVFSVQHVTLSFSSTTDKLYDVTNDEIIKSAGFKKFESIFLVSKNKYKDKIEHAYPYIKVRKIETIFPNKLVVHVCERMPYFAVKVSDSAYALIDQDLKVLEILDKAYVVGQNDPAIVNVQGYSLDISNFRPGYKCSGNFCEELGKLINELTAYDIDELTAYDMFKDITFAASYHKDITLQTHYALTIQIQSSEYLFEEKIASALSAYAQYLQEEQVGTIIVAGTDSVSTTFVPLSA